MDCLIVIGTTFDQKIASLLGNKAMSNNSIIEINPQQLLNISNVPRLIGNIEDSVTRLCKVIKCKTEEYLKKQDENDVD